MPEAFSDKMGAIRIISKGDGQQHRGPKISATPPGWKPIKARKYISSGGSLGLVDVIRSGILDDENPVLIIVHMNKVGSWDKETVKLQAEVIKAAKSKKLIIYVVQKVDPDDHGTMKNKAAIKDTLPDNLAGAVEEYEQLYYFAEKLPGNALEGRDFKGGGTLRAYLKWLNKNLNTKIAILFGQSYTQCVDSTILGMYYTEFRKINGKVSSNTSYLPGLLDIGIDVVTARDVLVPPQVGRHGDGTSYFEFNIDEDIVLDGTSGKLTPTQEISAKPTALIAPTNAAIGYPDKAAIVAPTKL